MADDIFSLKTRATSCLRQMAAVLRIRKVTKANGAISTIQNFEVFLAFIRQPGNEKMHSLLGNKHLKAGPFGTAIATNSRFNHIALFVVFHGLQYIVSRLSPILTKYRI